MKPFFTIDFIIPLQYNGIGFHDASGKKITQQNAGMDLTKSPFITLYSG